MTIIVIFFALKCQYLHLEPGLNFSWEGANYNDFRGPRGHLRRIAPYVMEMNITALCGRAADSPVLERYNVAARILTGNTAARAEDGIVWVKDLCRRLQVESLAHLGLKKADFAVVVAKSQKASSMQGSPIRLSESE